MKVNKQVLAFQHFLNQSWTAVHELADEENGLDDWKQANWEILVEAVVLDPEQFLEVYGEGADCNGSSSRVWKPAALPTHAIHLRPKYGKSLVDRLSNGAFPCPSQGLLMDQFVTLSEEDWYESEPPFDHVLAMHDHQERVLLVEDVDFVLCKHPAP